MEDIPMCYHDKEHSKERTKENIDKFHDEQSFTDQQWSLIESHH